MTQIPITDSVSAYQATNQTASLGTCDVRENGWGQCPIKVPNNASIGDPWGGYPLDFGTTNTSEDKWDDLTNVDRNPHQTAMGSLDYGVPIYKSNGANPPLMTDYESERSSSTDKSQPTKGTSDDNYDDLTKVNNNPRKIVIGNHESEVTVSESKRASPSPTIVCQCDEVYPTEESEPTGETEGGWESVLGPIGAVGGATLLGYTGYRVVQDSGLKSKYDGRAQLNNIYATPKWQQTITNATSAFTNTLGKTLGFKEKEDKDWTHPYYRVVSKGDDEQGKTGRSAVSITQKPSGNKSHRGSNNSPNGRSRGQRSYIP